MQGEPGSVRRKRPSTPVHEYLTPFTIALGYFALGAAWILFSDRAAAVVAGEAGAELLSRFQTLKGLAYILITALLLWSVLRLTRSTLVASERRYRQMFEQTSAIALIVDPEKGTIVNANQAATDFYGWPREQLIGKPVSEINTLSPGEIARHMADARASSGSRFVFEHRTASGRKCSVEVYSGPVDVDGRPLLFSIIHDLTGRIEAERALEASEIRYRTLLHEASDGIYLANAKARFLDINPKGCEMLGYTRAEILGLTMDDLVPAEDVARTPFRMDELFAGKTVLQERRLRRKDRSFLHAEISCRLREDGCIQGVVRDIGERRRLEDQLRQAQKMEAVGQLTGGIAHDLNNVLGIVIANADLVRQALPPDRADVSSDVDAIKRAAHRGADMIRKLLGFSRQSPLEVVSLDLAVAVGEVLDTLHRLLPSNIVIERHGPESAVPVHADRGALEQILLNLGTNARDAMPDGGTLHVSVSSMSLGPLEDALAGSYACLVVRDTGQGMSEEVLARMFDPFFTTKPPAQGSGLGMAMVYGLVRQQQGTIKVESVQDAGTSVTICFPAMSPPPLPAEPHKAGKPLPTGTETILLVEDEVTLRAAASRILTRLGYTVMTAGDGEEALEFVRRGEVPVALIISDIMMPRRNGRGLYDALKADGQPARFLFSSGYGGGVVDGIGEEAGGPQLLRKPWTAEELALKVREVLDADQGLARP